MIPVGKQDLGNELKGVVNKGKVRVPWISTSSFGTSRRWQKWNPDVEAGRRRRETTLFDFIHFTFIGSLTSLLTDVHAWHQAHVGLAFPWPNMWFTAYVSCPTVDSVVADLLYLRFRDFPVRTCLDLRLVLLVVLTR